MQIFAKKNTLILENLQNSENNGKRGDLLCVNLN